MGRAKKVMRSSRERTALGGGARTLEALAMGDRRSYLRCRSSVTMLVFPARSAGTRFVPAYSSPGREVPSALFSATIDASRNFVAQVDNGGLRILVVWQEATTVLPEVYVIEYVG